jgi:hypothetical protein
MSKIKLNNVRLSFPSLFQKATFEGKETKFEATLLLDKDTHAETIAEIQAAIKLAIKEKLGGAKVGADKLCMKDGDDSDYEGYAGTMSLKAANAKRPLVIDRDKTPLAESDNRPILRLLRQRIIELWAQNNAYGKRINANLLAVQFYKDGQPFGDAGANASVNDFDAFDDESDDDIFG